jgi:hypothetical protein
MNTHAIIAEMTALAVQIAELSTKLQNAAMPPEQQVLDDVQLRKELNVSKRTTAYWREKNMIIYSQPSGKVFYKRSDVLAFLKKYEVPDIDTNLK